MLFFVVTETHIPSGAVQAVFNSETAVRRAGGF
jgi:hypothetical protein